jgi:hypothetical protein
MLAKYDRLDGAGRVDANSGDKDYDESGGVLITWAVSDILGAQPWQRC